MSDLRRGGKDDGQKAEALLQALQVAQHAFWDALTALEDELGLEIDGNHDLSALTIDNLEDAFNAR